MTRPDRGRVPTASNLRIACGLTRPQLAPDQLASGLADSTSMLSEEAAGAVEEKILPNADGSDHRPLRARLRLAVIAADPDGAEQRRNLSNGTFSCRD